MAQQYFYKISDLINDKKYEVSNFQECLIKIVKESDISNLNELVIYHTLKDEIKNDTFININRSYDIIKFENIKIIDNDQPIDDNYFELLKSYLLNFFNKLFRIDSTFLPTLVYQYFIEPVAFF